MVWCSVEALCLPKLNGITATLLIRRTDQESVCVWRWVVVYHVFYSFTKYLWVYRVSLRCLFSFLLFCCWWWWSASLTFYSYHTISWCTNASPRVPWTVYTAILFLTGDSVLLSLAMEEAYFPSQHIFRDKKRTICTNNHHPSQSQYIRKNKKFTTESPTSLRDSAKVQNMFLGEPVIILRCVRLHRGIELNSPIAHVLKKGSRIREVGKKGFMRWDKSGQDKDDFVLDPHVSIVALYILIRVWLAAVRYMTQICIGNVNAQIIIPTKLTK